MSATGNGILTIDDDGLIVGGSIVAQDAAHLYIGGEITDVRPSDKAVMPASLDVTGAASVFLQSTGILSGVRQKFRRLPPTSTSAGLSKGEA